MSAFSPTVTTDVIDADLGIVEYVASQGDCEARGQSVTEAKSRLAALLGGSLSWRIEEWHGQYCFMYLIACVSPGLHRTINGKTVRVAEGQGTCAWSGCSLMPKFASESEARQYATENRINLVA